MMQLISAVPPINMTIYTCKKTNGMKQKILYAMFTFVNYISLYLFT